MEWIWQTLSGLLSLLGNTLLNWPWGTLAFFVILIIIVAYSWFFVRTLLHIADYYHRPVEQAIGTVVGKTFEPGCPNLQLVTDYSPEVATALECQEDEFELTIEIGDKRDTVVVGRRFHNLVRRGQKLMAYYKTGRLSGEIYIRSVQILC